MSLQFHVVDAFTNRAFGGNPAAVIVLPENHSYPDSLLQKIALQFNLSETAFVTPQAISSSPESNHVTFGLRWFTPATEVLICGHATLASASILFNNTDLVPRNINQIHFSTRWSGILIARRVVDTPKIELEFPAGDYEKVDQEIHSKAQKMMIEGASLEGKDVLYVGAGKSSPYTEYLLVEIDPKIDLKSLRVNAALLASYQPKYPITVITNQAISEEGKSTRSFNVRVFAHEKGIDEDPVTGSASSFATKYWANKANVPPGEPMQVTQVSSRVGDIEVIWNDEKGTSRLRGEARIASKGEIYI